MSTFVDVEIPCPHCGDVVRREIAQSLNGHRMPEFVDAIRRGTFQQFVCRACHQDYVVDAPFVLIDFPNKLWIFQFPAREEPRWRAHQAVADTNWKHTMIDHAIPIVEDLREGMVRRTVFGLTALAEKLAIFDAGLDDAVIEALKLAILRSGGPIAFAPRDRLRFVEATDSGLAFATVQIDDAGTETHATLEVATERYEALAADPAWRSVVGDVGAGQSYVDIGRVLFDGGAAPVMPEYA